MSKGRIKQLIKGAAREERRESRFTGRIGKKDASGNWVTQVPGRSVNWVYVRPDMGGQAMAAYLDGAPLKPDAPVIVEYNVTNGLPIITSINHAYADAYSTNPDVPFTSVPPAPTGAGTGREDFTYAAMLLDGLITPQSSGLVVNINKFSIVYHGSQVFYAGGTFDLTSYVPSVSGDWCYTLVGYDIVNAVITAIASANVEASWLLNDALIAAINITNIVPLMAVVLKNGQTTPSSFPDQFRDCRPWITGNWLNLPVEVAYGGTGASGFIVNELLLGNGTSPFQVVANGTAGQPLLATVGAPAYGALDLAGASTITGLLPLAHGGTDADLSATGGAHQVVMQETLGGAFTVRGLLAGDTPQVLPLAGGTLTGPVVFTPQATPSTAEGKVYYDSTAHALEYYNGSAWVSLTADTGITQLTGDVTAGPGSGSQVATLATVNSSPGTYALATLTVNGKGLVTAASAAAVTGSGSVVLASGPTLTSPAINTGVSGTAISTDGTFATQSDTIIASQKAVYTYVNAVAQGLSPKNSVVCASNGALPANTYANGSSGVGATLTGNATGVLTVDGHTVALNERVLVKDEVTQANNGIYLCTTAGAVGVAYVLTRATDNNTSVDIVGAYTFVETGTVNASSGWVNTNTGTITIGTTSITWTQFSGAGEITAGTGLIKSGNTLSIDSTVVTLTGSQTLTNKNLTAPTIADFSNANHNHQSTAGGGTLTTAAITSGTFANSFINWASPGALGSTTPNTVAATNFTLTSGGYISPSSDGTAALLITKANGTTAIVTVDSTNTRVVINDSTGTGTDVLSVHAKNQNPYAASFYNDTFSSTQALRWFILNNGSTALGTDQSSDFRLYVNGDYPNGNIIINGADKHTTLRVVDTVTTGVSDVNVIHHSSTNTPVAGFGTGLRLDGKDSTTADMSMARWRTFWHVATHASNQAYSIFSAFDSGGERDVIGIGADGSNPLFGIFTKATSPVAQNSAYTQTYSTTTRTVNPASTSAFTGQDNTQIGSVYAKSADLEQLRGDVLQMAQLINSLINDDGNYGFHA